MSNAKSAPESRGVSVELLSVVDLDDEIDGLTGRQLRMRKVTIEPGGVFGPTHGHVGRPGTVYVLQGTITDHRNGAATEYGPGPGWAEDRHTMHWLENTGTISAVEISVDIALTLGACGAFKQVVSVGDDVVRASAGAIKTGAPLVNRIPGVYRAELRAKVVEFLESAEWQAVKNKANQAFQLSRQEPVCSTVVDLVMKEDSRSLAGIFQSQAEALQGMSEGGSVRADAEFISEWLDEGGVGADWEAHGALLIAGFQDLYCA